MPCPNGKTINHVLPETTSVLFNRKGPAAPAPARVGAGEEEESCLGTVPHTLRGSLHAFTQVVDRRKWIIMHCILHLKRFLRLPPRDLHSHSAQHAAHQYWRPLTVKGGSWSRKLGRNRAISRIWLASLPSCRFATIPSNMLFNRCETGSFSNILTDLITSIELQDSSLMDGVIDLADDDCISLSSSCDWTLFVHILLRSSSDVSRRPWFFPCSPWNAVFLTYCDIVYDMRLWTFCTGTRLTIMWPHIYRYYRVCKVYCRNAEVW